MRNVNLKINELEKYKIIKDLVEHNGNKNKACCNLGLSIREINGLIIIYKEKGKSRLYTWQPRQKNQLIP